MKDLSQYNGKFVVYLMTFPNGKKYCGYSSNIKRRWRDDRNIKLKMYIKQFKNMDGII